MSRAKRQLHHSYDDGELEIIKIKKNYKLYKYVKFDTLIKIIENFNLKLLNPTEANDPFEFLLKGTNKHAAIIKNYRILCLSLTGISPTMLAHYSDDHKGACLEFEFEGQEFFLWNKR